MPIYEFRCRDCGKQYEELVSLDVDRLPCPDCGSENTSRMISLFSASGTSSPAGRGGSNCATASCATKSCYT
jgi:putative FmdB family regulatory protein